MEQAPDVLGIEAIRGRGGFEQARHLSVLDHDALGLAGGAGGVDHIGEVLRGEAGHDRVGRRALGRQRARVEQTTPADRGLAEGGATGGIGEHDGRIGIGEDLGRMLAGIGGVEGDIGATGLEDGEQADDQGGRSLDADGHAGIGLHAEGDELVRELVGAGVELGIAEGLLLEHEGDGVGRALDLLLERLVNAMLLGIVRLRRISIAQQQLALLGRQDVDMIERLRLVPGHRPQHGLQVSEMPFDRGALEQCRRITEHTGDRLAVLLQRQFQVELDGVVGQRQRAHIEVRQLQGSRRSLPGLPTEHHLEQRRVIQVAGRVDDLDDLLEGQVLVVLRGKRRLAHAREQGGGVGRAGQIEAQRQRVDEEADQRLDFLAIAIRAGGADHDVLLARQPREHGGPGGHHGHEQRHAMRLRQAAQRRGEPGIQLQRCMSAGKRLLRGTGMVGGQVEPDRRIGERVAPILALGLQALARQQLSMPGRVVGVLDRQRREQIGPAIQAGPIERLQFAEQDVEGPAVRDDVMLGQQERMLVLAQADQASADQRAVLQVEGRMRLPDADGLQLLLRVERIAQVVMRDRQGGADRQQPHLRLALDRDEYRAQRLVTIEQGVERALPCCCVEPALQAQRQRDVIGGADAIELGEEPQPLLGEGQRQLAVARNRRDGRQRGGALLQPLVNDRGQAGERGRGEQAGERQLGAERGDAADQPHGEQGMPAEREEPIVAADALDAEQLGPDFGERGLDLALGRFIGLTGERGRIRHGQRASVELAVGRQRQGVEAHIGGRHHVGRHGGEQVRVQRLDVEGRVEAILGHAVGDHALVAGLVLARDDHGAADLGPSHDPGLDFAELDAKAPDLDLEVVAADELQIAVGPIAHEIAGAVQASTGLGGVGVVDEALGAEFGPVQVAAHHAGSADIQLARRADRNRLTVFVENVEAGVRDRPADRDVLARLDAVDLVPAGEGHGFGGAVDMQQVPRLAAPQHLGDALRIHRFAAEHQVMQFAEGIDRLARDLVEQRGGQEQGGDLALLELRGQRGRREQGFLPDHLDARAVQQRGPDLEGGRVEGRVGGEREGGVRLHLEVIGVAHQPDHAVVRDHHALRRAGRARGIDHIGEVPRGEALRCRVGAGGAEAVPGGVGIVEQHHRDGGAAGDRSLQAALCQQRDWFAVLEHELQALGGISGVQRHVGAAGLEDGERADHQVEAAFDAQGDSDVGTHAEIEQVMGKPVGPGIECSIGERVVVERHRDRIGRVERLRLEQRGDAAFPRERRIGVVPSIQQLVALGLGEQRQPVHGSRVVPRHGEQQRSQVGDMPFHGGRIVQRRRVAERAGDLLAVLLERQLQVELGRIIGQRQRRDVHARQRQRLPLSGLPGEHRLEQRRISQAAGRVDDLDDLLEGQVLVILRGQGGLAHAREQGGGVGRAGQIQAQRQRVDEEADQRRDFAAVAVRAGGADHQVLLARQPREHDGPGGHHGHEQRHAMGLRQAPERLRELGVEAHRHVSAGERLLRGTRPIGGQLEQDRRIGERAAPVVDLGLQAFAREPLALPGGIVGVLNGQRRERIGQAIEISAIERLQFAQQDLEGPAVGHDVMLGQQERVFVLGQADQTAADQRAAFEIEGGMGLLRADALQLLLRVGYVTQIVMRDGQGGAHRQQPHLRLAADRHEGRAQRLVTIEQGVERALPCRRVEPASQAQRQRDVVGGTDTIELGQEPQPLLGERQRQLGLPIASGAQLGFDRLGLAGSALLKNLEQGFAFEPIGVIRQIIHLGTRR